MAFNFVDTNAAAPFYDAQDKVLHTRAYKVTTANFSTTGVNTLIGILPNDASITGISLWNKTEVSGSGLTGATISIGKTSGGTDFINAYNVEVASGTKVGLSPITNILQPYVLPFGPNIQLWLNGTTTGANPTAGELYLIVDYVR